MLCLPYWWYFNGTWHILFPCHIVERKKERERERKKEFILNLRDSLDHKKISCKAKLIVSKPNVKVYYWNQFVCTSFDVDIMNLTEFQMSHCSEVIKSILYGVSCIQTNNLLIKLKITLLHSYCKGLSPALPVSLSAYISFWGLVLIIVRHRKSMPYRICILNYSRHTSRENLGFAESKSVCWITQK